MKHIRFLFAWIPAAAFVFSFAQPAVVATEPDNEITAASTAATADNLSLILAPIMVLVFLLIVICVSIGYFVLKKEVESEHDAAQIEKNPKLPAWKFDDSPIELNPGMLQADDDLTQDLSAYCVLLDQLPFHFSSECQNHAARKMDGGAMLVLELATAAAKLLLRFTEPQPEGGDKQGFAVCPLEYWDLLLLIERFDVNCRFLYTKSFSAYERRYITLQDVYSFFLKQNPSPDAKLRFWLYKKHQWYVRNGELFCDDLDKDAASKTPLSVPELKEMISIRSSNIRSMMDRCGEPLERIEFQTAEFVRSSNMDLQDFLRLAGREDEGGGPATNP